MIAIMFKCVDVLCAMSRHPINQYTGHCLCGRNNHRSQFDPVVAQWASEVKNPAPIDPEPTNVTVRFDTRERLVVKAALQLALWHTDFFFRSESEREVAVGALEKVTGTQLPRSLWKHPKTKGH